MDRLSDFSWYRIMKIVADEDIFWVKDYFGHSGELILKPGRMLCRQDVIDADMLLVRSVTPVNRELLQNTKVKWVGTATIGTDHLDIEWLHSQGIRWHSAIGCNAIAVTEYVINVIAALQQESHLPMQHLRVGIVGVGQIGARVAAQLQSLGCEILLCDPLRAESENNFKSIPLNELCDVDVISLHVPLTRQGNHPTYHLIAKNILKKQKKHCVLINTSRGSVIDFTELKHYGQHLQWCLDVWENEPVIDLSVLQQAVIATPHIAGYSLQSKHRAIAMLYQTAVKDQFILPISEPKIELPTFTVDFDNADWQEQVLAIYDPRMTTKQMKAALKNDPMCFDLLRKSFIDRSEYTS